MKTALAHVCIKVKNLEETLKFYQDILGFRKVFDFTHKGRLHGFYLEIGQRQFLECFDERSGGNPAISPLSHICLETDDIDSMKQRLEAHGIEVSEKKLGGDQTYQVWFKDPDGIDIEFHQYTDKSSQFTGEPVEVDWLD
ncbi:MAG: VOC family protein [Spirochaetales bacterium]|nr:VOC family protein [Spirochaetales bacterium]